MRAGAGYAWRSRAGGQFCKTGNLFTYPAAVQWPRPMSHTLARAGAVIGCGG